MNFFEHQDQARRNTAWLVGLFVAAIAAMIAALYLSIILTLRTTFQGTAAWWQPELFMLISVIMLSIIGYGSLTKMFQLRQGGMAVAESLGGSKIHPQTNNAQEIQLLNVVAEMALASGTPVPTVYLLSREPGINAFAAGYSPDDAVIGVTQGCLEQLSRDELQGVIAHEFSHILNGDMRLNLRLIGVLQGLLFIHILGRMFLRGGVDINFLSDDDEGVGAPFVIIGVAMAAIGGVGVIFGRLIKSTVSRQREFLADASAVQFTRNPDGLAGALRRIGGFAASSKMRTPRAEEASHLFFGEATTFNFLNDWFATHPPLKDRIRRISGGKVTQLGVNAGTHPAAPLNGIHEASTMGLHSSTARTPMAKTSNSQGSTNAAATFVAQVGTASPQQLAQAQTFLQTLPSALSDAVRSPQGAIAIVYALLIDPQADVRSRQLAALKTAKAGGDPEQVAQLAQILQGMDTCQHLPLLDLAIPALRTITAQQCADFFKQIKMLVRADGKLTVSEYVLQVILQKRLRPHFQKPSEHPPSITHLEPVWQDIEVVLTILARIGHQNPADALYALKSGLSRLPGANKREQPKTLPAVKLYDLGQSLKHLEPVVPKLKQAIVDAAAHTVLVDNDVVPQEAELLRAIVISLDCPIPPFLESRVKTQLPRSR
ncbi:MAG: M48 family metalloprotease [Cyanobacteria bacterium P01_H01_bin.58]